MTLAMNSARFAGPRDPEGGGRNEKEDDIVKGSQEIRGVEKGESERRARVKKSAWGVLCVL